MSDRKLKDATLRQLRKLKAKWRDQVMYDKRLKPAARCVLYDLADFATMDQSALDYQDKGKVIVFPSQAGIAERLGLNPSTVSSAIKQAADRGHLKRLSRGNGMTGTSSYRLILQKSGDNASEISNPRRTEFSSYDQGSFQC